MFANYVNSIIIVWYYCECIVEGPILQVKTVLSSVKNICLFFKNCIHSYCSVLVFCNYPSVYILQHSRIRLKRAAFVMQLPNVDEQNV